MISKMITIKIWRASVRLFVPILFVLGSSGPLYAADSIRGGNLYAANCAACHGMSGISVMPGAPNFARGERLLQPDLMLLATIKAGKNVMPSFQGILSDNDILNIIAYIRTLN